MFHDALVSFAERRDIIMGKRMNISQLQGTPWHTEQLKRTCNDGSKHCIYNHNICSCKFNKKYFHKECVGKGKCEWFESKAGTPKVYSETTYKMEKKETQKMGNDVESVEAKKTETKSEKFKKLSTERIAKIEKAIENLGNLSNKSIYDYTDEEVEKMFSYLEEKLSKTKGEFKGNKSSGFSW